MIGCYVRDGINVIENLDDGCKFWLKDRVL